MGRVVPFGGVSRSGLRVLMLVALSVSLVLLGTPARAQYLCRMMGVVGTSCCCPATATSREARRETTIRSADCCERLVAATRTTAAPPRDLVPSVGSAVLAATLPVTPYDVVDAQLALVLPPQARAPPALRPPLFIVHCALLI